MTVVTAVVVKAPLTIQILPTAKEQKQVVVIVTTAKHAPLITMIITPPGKLKSPFLMLHYKRSLQPCQVAFSCLLGYVQ